MEIIIKNVIGAGILAMVTTTTANAALMSRLGGQAYYDDVLDITWLTNANLADTNTFGVSGINDNGMMDFATANSWITAMNADSGTGYLGFNNWRMPTLVDTGASGCDWSFDGTDCGYNSETSTSEFASMYYDTMGLLGSLDVDGIVEVNVDLVGVNADKALPFDNFKRSHYWFGLEYAPDLEHAWHFDMHLGRQLTYIKTADAYVTAVISGDIAIAAVPIPAAVWLFGSGLLGLVAVSRRKNNS